MKKKLALFLTGVIVLSLLGCGRTQTTADVPTQDETVSDTDDTDTTETVTDTDQETQPGTETSSDPKEEAAQEDPLSQYKLRELFASHGMKVGTCLTTRMFKTKKSSEFLTSQFSSVTMENAMKPDSILDKKASQESGDLVVSFGADMIKMLDWAKENNMAMRGHTLVWHSQTPEWIFYEDFDTKKALVSRDVMLARLTSYIKQVFEKLEEGGYLELFYAYDVANECWMEDGSMRDSKWKQTIGDDYLWQTFNIANQYAPESVDLYYNDYNEQFKTETLVNFVNTLVDENGNYLIDGVGFQAHLYTSDDLDEYFQTVDALAATGLKVEITELDVCLGKYQGYLPDTEENLQEQGRYYYNLIQGIFQRVDAGTLNMDALTFWGYSDSMSWRSEAHPLLLNALNQPKYAFYGAMQIREKAGFTEE